MARAAESREPEPASPWPTPAGEVARLMRGFDWASTPLGPLEGWPQSLKTVVDVIVGSPWPMAAVWGDDLVQLYNDPFAALLGGAHPTALGRPVRQHEAGAGWIDASICERVMAGEVSGLEDSPFRAGTSGHARPSCPTFSYAPLRREDGRIGGVLIAAVGAAAQRSGAEGDRDVSPPRSGFGGDLADLERRLDMAMEASSAGAWSWNAQTNQSTWDDRYHAMYGFAADEPRTHEAWLERIHTDDRPGVVARLNAVLQTPGDDAWNIEFRAVSPALGVRWMQGLGRALRDSDGRVVSITGINLDVTARKQAEQKLRESEEQLRLLFDTAPAAVAMCDREMRYLAVSRRWLRDFALTGDVVGRSVYDVVPEIPERWKEVHRRCLAGAVESGEADRLERADGSTKWLRWQVLPWRTAAGEVGGIVILCEDITENRRWIERQRVLVDELQHRTRNLIAVVQSIAQQTMRAADSADVFMAKFTRRLAALARVQGLLSRSDREPITIGALVRMELEALGSDATASSMHVEGPEVQLPKRDVQTLALAIHELATNARKHGALAAQDGRLAVTWRVERADDGGMSLELEWVESGMERRRAGGEAWSHGYGRTLIERALPYALAAETSFELGEEGFRCGIRLPIDPRENPETKES